MGEIDSHILARRPGWVTTQIVPHEIVRSLFVRCQRVRLVKHPHLSVIDESGSVKRLCSRPA